MRDFIFLKDNGTFFRILFNELQYVECIGKYVRVVTVRNTFVVHYSLRHIATLLPVDQFCRVHKSFIISFDHVTAFNLNSITIGAKKIPVGKQYRALFNNVAQVVFSTAGGDIAFRPLTKSELRELLNNMNQRLS